MSGIAARCALARYPLPAAVGGSGVASVDLLTIELDAFGECGVGFSYVLGGSDDLALRAARLLCERHLGDAAEHPLARWRRIIATFNRTGGGPLVTALAALDVAGWDLYARRLGVPLGVAMGGTRRAVPVYASGGYRANDEPDAIATRVREDLARGLRAVKLRVAGTPSDGPRVRAAAAALGDHGALLLDANEKCDRATALRLVRLASETDAAFVEEPLPSWDLEGYRALTSVAPVAIATGEHARSVADLASFVRAGCALVQPDLQALGGLTPAWLAAVQAEAHGVAVAPHFLPGLFVHLAAAAPNVTWLEEFPLLEPLLDGWPALAADGTLQPRDVPGHGLTLAPALADLTTPVTS